ncbi:aminopeptidase N [Lingula anatina]|uniref:Aminopeptidase n=1 Tax=Lingula anatina TaxID=7574 RepID=A0A1S3I2L9_LINAN|nr:aminopeptidase N [Lingula anatina]|eukprot:XP_013391589.1 aminopeptidase N [Lingula anatina]
MTDLKDFSRERMLNDNNHTENNVDAKLTHNDKDVKVVRPKRSWQKHGCYVSRLHILLLIVAGAVVVISTGLLAGLLGRRAGCGYGGRPASASNASQYPDGDSVSGAVTAKNSGPPQPWDTIRLPRNIIPYHYTLRLRVDLDTFIFNGSVEINTKIKNSTNFIILHSNLLNISSRAVHVTTRDRNGVKTHINILQHFHADENNLLVLQVEKALLAGQECTIYFGEFTGPLSDDLRGLYRSLYKTAAGEVRYIAVSQLQAVDARKIFPCFDEPDMKANFTVTIQHTQDYKAISNMPLRVQTTLPDGWIEDEFETTPTMSTYLLAFVVADFTYRETQLPSGLRIRIWSRPDKYEQTAFALEFAKEAYQFFSDYFGIPEEVPKADHVAVPDFSAGAMENWGCVLYRETALLFDPTDSSVASKYWIALVMAHEVAHTWFGNMATMKWWDDLWLNEGFASTLMYFVLDHVFPDWKVFDLQVVDDIFPVMIRDSVPTSHPVSSRIEDPDDIPQFFDHISYDKGMAVLRLLRGLLGWKDFQNGLQRYVRKYKFRNAEMSELWSVFTEVVSNKYDVGEAMDTWTRQMNFPVVTLSKVTGNTYRLTQERFLLMPEESNTTSTNPYKYMWNIPFTYTTQNYIQDSHLLWLKEKSVDFEVPDHHSGLMVGNVNYTGFYMVNYDDGMWERLLEQLRRDHTAFSASNRAGFIHDALVLGRAGLLNYGVALNISSYLKRETEYVPWNAFLLTMEYLKVMLSNSDAYGMLKTYLRDLVSDIYKTLNIGATTGGPLPQRYLRRAILHAAVRLQLPEALEYTRTLYDQFRKYRISMPADYALIIFSAAIYEGGENDWDFLWNVSQTTNVPSQSSELMQALAYSQKPWLLWRYLRWTMDEAKIRPQNVKEVFSYFKHTSLGRTISLKFFMQHWQQLNERFQLDTFSLRDITYETTHTVSNEFDLQMLKDLYKRYPPAGVAQKAVESSIAIIESNIRWMKTNENAILTWLTKYISLRGKT